MSTLREEIEFYVAIMKAAGYEPPRRGRMSDKLYVAVLRNRLAATRAVNASVSFEQGFILNTNNGRKWVESQTKQAYMTKGENEVLYERNR